MLNRDYFLNKKTPSIFAWNFGEKADLISSENEETVTLWENQVKRISVWQQTGKMRAHLFIPSLAPKSPICCKKLLVRPSNPEPK